MVHLNILTAAAPAKQGASTAKARTGPGRDSFFCLSIVAASISVTLVHLIAFNQPKVTFLFDAGHYLLSLQKLTAVFMSLLQMRPDLELIRSRQLFDLINLDGPVLASIHALVFAVAGRIPRGADWVTVAIVQSIFQAISSVAIFAIAKKFTARLMPALTASVLWIFYAPASIAAGRLLNECLGTTLELLVVCLAISSLPASSLLLGVSSALLFLLKPAAAPSLVMVALLSSVSSTKPWKRFILVAVGAAAIAGSWLVYTGCVGGSPQITTNRSPAFNLATGFDIENSAWSTKPESRLVSTCMDEAAPLAMPLGVSMSHPGEVWALMLSKLVRIFLQPWNDFKHSFLGLPYDLQLAMHQFIASIGIAGLVVWVCALAPAKRNSEKSLPASAQQNAVGSIVAILLFGHLIYLLFEPVSRYGFTAVPLLLIFGAFFIGSLQRAVIPKWAAISAAAAAASFVLSLSQIAGSSIDEGIALSAKPGTYSKEIFLPGNFDGRSSHGLVLVDCDSRFSSAAVTLEVNGHAVSVLLQPVQCFDDSVYGSEYLLQFAAGAGIDTDRLRQWRAAFVPGSLLLPGRNLLRLTSKTGGTIFASPDTKRRLPSLVQYSITQLSASRSFESRLIEPVLAARDSSAAAAPEGRIRLALFKVESEPTGTGDATANGAAQVFFQKEVKAIDWDRWMRADAETLRINRWSLTAVARNDCRIEVPVRPCSHALCEVSLSMRGPARPGAVGVVATVEGVNGRTFILQKNATAVRVTPQWQSFKLRELVPTGMLGGAIKSVTLSLYPGPWHQTALYGADRHCGDALVKDMTIRLSKLSMPRIRLTKARVY